jgi:CheY-like chemotaxis protein
LYWWRRFPAFFTPAPALPYPDEFLRKERSCKNESLGRKERMSMLALVIDDSMLIRHTVSRFLESRGFKVEAASNGVAAMEAMQTLRPDLILTDLQMPQLSGYQLIDALKADEATAAIPILVLAARPLADVPLNAQIHTLIYKDLNVEEQLDQALESLFPGLPRAE